MNGSDLIAPLIIALVTGGLAGVVVWKAYDLKEWYEKRR